MPTASLRLGSIIDAAGIAPVDFDCVTSATEGGLRTAGTTTLPGALQTFTSFGSIKMCAGTPHNH